MTIPFDPDFKLKALKLVQESSLISLQCSHDHYCGSMTFTVEGIIPHHVLRQLQQDEGKPTASAYEAVNKIPPKIPPITQDEIDALNATWRQTGPGSQEE